MGRTGGRTPQVCVPWDGMGWAGEKPPGKLHRRARHGASVARDALPASRHRGAHTHTGARGRRECRLPLLPRC